MSRSTQCTVVDISVPLPGELRDAARTFKGALGYIERLYEIQLSRDLTSFRENALWREFTSVLSEGASKIPDAAKGAYEESVSTMERGIFDLYPLSVMTDKGEDVIELLAGKVFSSESDGRSFYAGMSGAVNKEYADLINEYDDRLESFLQRLPYAEPETKKQAPASCPEIKCMDVFSLAGGLNQAYKPICVFYSGKTRENLSSLSRMTVFINLYAARFGAMSERLAMRYIHGAEALESLAPEEEARLLLLWLRGHDTGHFMGTDRLGRAMHEMDRDYMILHELKADMVALYNLRHLTDGVLDGCTLEQAYLVVVAEMFRYMRRGGFYVHPDTGSAYLAYRFFRDKGAVRFDPGSGKFHIELKVFEDAVEEFTAGLLKLFSDGDISRARGFINSWGWLAAAEKDGLTRDCPDELRSVIEDAEIPNLIDYNFVTTED